MILEKRSPIIRFMLLCVIVSLVTLAFWYNFQKQLSLVMHNSYIYNGDSFLNKDQEKAYTKTLRLFSSNIGITAKIIFLDGTKPLPKEENTLLFVVEMNTKKGYILYPPIMKQSFSQQEKVTLDTTLTSLIQKKEWHTDLNNFIYDVYTLLSES